MRRESRRCIEGHQDHRHRQSAERSAQQLDCERRVMLFLYVPLALLPSRSLRLRVKHGLVVVEGFPGFAVVETVNGVLVSTNPSPGIALERLSREIVSVADGPIRLLEETPCSFVFQRTLTRK